MKKNDLSTISEEFKNNSAISSITVLDQNNNLMGGELGGAGDINNTQINNIFPENGETGAFRVHYDFDVDSLLEEEKEERKEEVPDLRVRSNFDLENEDVIIECRLLDLNNTILTIDLDANPDRHEMIQESLLLIQKYAERFNVMNDELKNKSVKIFNPEIIENILSGVRRIVEFDNGNRNMNAVTINRITALYNDTVRISRNTWDDIRDLQTIQEVTSWNTIFGIGALAALVGLGFFFLWRNQVDISNHLNVNLNQSRQANASISQINDELRNLRHEQIDLIRNIRNTPINVQHPSLWSGWRRDTFLWLNGFGVSALMRIFFKK